MMPNKSRGCVKSADEKFGNDQILDMGTLTKRVEGMVEKCPGLGGWFCFAGLPFGPGRFSFRFQ